MVLGHLEEVGLLLALLERDAEDRVLVVGELRLVLGHERLLFHVVVARVAVEVDVALVQAHLPKLLRDLLVVGVGGANVAVVRDRERLVQRLELGHVLVADVDRLTALLLGRVSNLLAVLVSASQKVNLPAVGAVVTTDDVRGDGLVRVAHVRWAVGVIDRSRQVELLALRRYRLRALHFGLRWLCWLRCALGVRGTLRVLSLLACSFTSRSLRSLLLALSTIGNEEKDCRCISAFVRFVANVEALTLELHDLALLHSAHVGVGNSLLLDPRLRWIVDEGLELCGIIARVVVIVL